MALEARIAALDEALENGGDLWGFGTQTLKGFADKNFDEHERLEFEDLLDPDDPLLQSDFGRSSPPPDDDLAALDAALADGDLSEFGTRTLKALAHEAFDLEMARAMQAPAPAPVPVPAPPPTVPAPRLHVAPSSPRNEAPAASFGANTLRDFAAGAPPAGFPARNQGVAARPIPPLEPPAASPRGLGYGGPLHHGASPRATLPPEPPAKPAEWKISDDMMNQKWGSVLRTLQPTAMNTDSICASARGAGTPRMNHLQCTPR